MPFDADKFSNGGGRHAGRIAIAYVTDRNYHDMTLYALASVAMFHRKPVDFFLFQHEYAAAVTARYRSVIEAYGHSLTIEEAPPYDTAYSMTVSKHLTHAAFFRVSAIEKLAHSYEYVLYLDGDTLAFGDLRCDELAGFSEIAAACLDLSVSTGFDDPGFADNCRHNAVTPEYFNSGVMMINSRKWLEAQALDRFTEHLHQHAHACVYLTHCTTNDQCAFNLTLGGAYKRLPVTYNVQKSAFQTRAWADALLRHYTGVIKFVPVRSWRCDRKEYRLLRRISGETGLALPVRFFDFGFSYSLNALRRRRTVASYDSAIEEIEHRMARQRAIPPDKPRGAHLWH